MTRHYPDIEPYEQGMLDVGDNQHIYWEICGNPKGKTAVLLHGGPGSGCSPGMRRYFNPAAYRIILFDQRNCGRSIPHASNITTSLSTNTTKHLIADIEHLRQHLGIERWLLFGGSWGSTLALAYAQQFPKHITEIILVGVTMTRPSEIDWLYHGVAALFPEQWARFRAGAGPEAQDDDLVAAYYKLLQNPDPAIHLTAAKNWCEWENALVSPDPNYRPPAHRLEPAFQLTFARIVTHYFHHKAWLEDGILLQNIDKLAGIPSVLIHGRFDLSAPLVTAWQLAQAWPTSQLVLVHAAGHATSDPGMSEAIITATDHFAKP